LKKSKAETAQTRRRIVEIASKAFRSRGIEATGVAEIMTAAGLTHGGFYRHFASKEELVAEAVALSLERLALESRQAAEQGPESALNHALQYLSPASRENVEDGCTFASTGSELVRASEKTRHIASEAFKRALKDFAPLVHTPDDEDRISTAISVLTNMIGALTMARMVDDPKLSDRILEVTRERLLESVAAVAKGRQVGEQHAIA